MFRIKKGETCDACNRGHHEFCYGRKCPCCGEAFIEQKAEPTEQNSPTGWNLKTVE